MDREQINKIYSDYLNDCESEHDMEQIFDLALQAQADGDLISRSRMLAILKENYEFMTVDGYTDLFKDFIKFIKNQPSVAIPSSEPCVDAISRQHAIAEIYEEFMTIDMVHNKSDQRCMQIIGKLPSVSHPQDIIGYKCSTCKHNDKAWDELPCDGCVNNRNYEPQPTQTCVEPTHKHVENTLDCVGDRAISLETVIEWLKAKDIIKLSSQEEIARKELKQLPSVNPQEPSDDVVSREAVIDIIEDVCPIYGNDYRYILREKINELPSVSQSKTGYWKRRIVDSGYNADWKCSECGHKEMTDFPTNYCPNCGAKMERREDD